MSEHSTAELTMNWIINGIDIDKRKIEIRKGIEADSASTIIRALQGMSDISREPIYIEISSEGGDAYESLGIYDAIINCPCEVVITASGKIFSAAFVLFLAGDRRLATANSSFMMHSIRYNMDGDATSVDHEIEALEAKRVNNVFLAIADKRTKMNKSWWRRTVLPKNRYFSVDEALQFGIIDEVVVVPKKKVNKNVRKKV